MSYRVLSTPKAEKMFLKLPAAVQARLRPRIRGLAENPRPPGCIKLAGPDPLYRIRVGAFRVIYAIHDQDLLVLVVAVAGRGSVYRGV